MSLVQDKAQIEGRLRSIAVEGFTDPEQGVILLAEARQVPTVGGVGAWSLPVYFNASCAVCEWAFFFRQMPAPDAQTYGFGSNDLLKVQSWPVYHLQTAGHKRAWNYFKERSDLLDV